LLIAMADNTLNKLVALITSPEQVELRRAAVLVAGHLGSAKDRALVKTLLALVEDGETTLRLEALEALGRLQVEEILPRLVELAKQGGPEAEAAVRAAGHLGKLGAGAMASVMAEATPVLKRRIAAALAVSGTDSAVVATAQALRDEDPSVVEAAARSLAAEVPALGTGQRQALAEYLIQSLKGKRSARLTATSEAATIRVLGALQDPRSEEVYWSRLEPSYPAAIRAAALQALGTLPLPSNEAKLKRLLECAADADFHIVAPTLLLLQKLSVKPRNAGLWLRLLEAPDVATRRFAVDRLREVDTAEVARVLLPQLRHPDRALREAALAALRGSSRGRQALFEALQEAATVEETWSLARTHVPAAKELSAAQRAELFAQACRYQDKEDRRAEPLWFLLREADAEEMRQRLDEKALGLRKKKDYQGSLAYLRLLTRDPACSEELRLEQAALSLKLSSKDPAVVARNADPCLGQFARLLQDPAFDMIGRLSKAKWLDAEDLFYLGFHFAEQTHRAREFGRELLELVVKRSPKSEVGKSARRKLKSEGLAK
jgi:HEAT repeat protein